MQTFLDNEQEFGGANRVLVALVMVNQELASTTLLITHNADFAQMGDRVVRFADGMIRGIERNATRRDPKDLHW